MNGKPETSTGATGQRLAPVSLLCPDDSKRVADAIIAAIEDGQLNVADSAWQAITDQMMAGLTAPFGDVLISSIEAAVRSREA